LIQPTSQRFETALLQVVGRHLPQQASHLGLIVGLLKMIEGLFLVTALLPRSRSPSVQGANLVAGKEPR
jgi:hypothetical protein